MIRFYVNTVNSILMVLIWVSQVSRVTFQDIHRDLIIWLNHNPIEETNRSQRLRQFVAAGLEGKVLRNPDEEVVPGQDAMIDQILEQIRQAKEGMGRAGDLIDTIVRIIQLPYAPNRLALKTIKALRNAILLPEEIGGLITRLDKGEMHCGKCSKKFIDGEMLTLTNDGSQRLLACHKCAKPYYIAVDCCDQTIVISRKLRNYQDSGILCEQHAHPRRYSTRTVEHPSPPDAITEAQMNQQLHALDEIVARPGNRLDDDIELDEGEFDEPR